MNKNIEYTYLIEANGIYKIGKTKDIKTRLSAIQNANPFAELICYSDKVKESHLHVIFKDNRIKREWFQLDNDDLNRCIDMLSNGISNELEEFCKKYIKKKYYKKYIRKENSDRADSARRLRKALREKNDKIILNTINNWDFEKNGVISQSKLAKETGFGIATVKRRAKQFKTIIQEINKDYVNSK